MMHGREKSDLVIVAMKPANKAEGPSVARPAEEKHAAEPVEPRACPWLEQGRGPRGMRASKAGAGRSAGQACHRSWNAYGKSQGREGRRGSPRSSTTTVSSCSPRRSSNSRRMPPRGWIG